MSIKSFIKGKLKQREVKKLEPDENFEFEKEFYGESNIIEGFNFIYCNNYTDKFYNSKDMDRQFLSYISCVISLPNELKIIKDLVAFSNSIFDNNIPVALFDYRRIHFKITKTNIQLYLRGDYLFYNDICKRIHNNIFTKYIRNNLFIDDIFIDTPNEYLNNMYSSITNPSKEIDILFIENNIQCESFKPVIGLSIDQYDSHIKINDKRHFPLNNRNIVYFEIDKLTEDELSYLINNVKYGDKLLELVHKYKTNDDYSDIDEIIDEIIEE